MLQPSTTYFISMVVGFKYNTSGLSFIWQFKSAAEATLGEVTWPIGTHSAKTWWTIQATFTTPPGTDHIHWYWPSGFSYGNYKNLVIVPTSLLPLALPDTATLGGPFSPHGNRPFNLIKEPVNTATGNYVSQVTDFSLPGRGLPLAFTRTYNSADASVGSLGQGWTHSYAVRLESGPGDAKTFVDEGGARLVFTADGSGGFIAPHGTFSRLTAVGGGFDLRRRDQLVYHFDANGQLTSLADRNANNLAFTYTDGLLTRITDTVGRQVDLTYTAGRLTGLTGPPSRSVAYTYDPSGRLATVTDVRGKVTTYGYDANNRLASIVDANNHTVVTNIYAPDGRVGEQIDARGYHTTYAWDVGTQTSTVTDARLGQWIDVYSGNVLRSRRDPLGNTTSFVYDEDYNPVLVTDPRGNVTVRTYDVNGNLSNESLPASLNHPSNEFTYNAFNDPLTFRDRRGNTTTYEYDATGSLTKITAPLSAITLFGRDPAGTGLLVSTTDPRGKITTYGYDTQANLTSIATPLGNLTTMTYDGGGRMLTMVEPRGNAPGGDPAQYTTTFSHDLADHLLTVQDPLGNLRTNTYDPVGNLATVSDPNLHATSYGYDAADHLTSVTDARNKTTTYGYDEVGNLTTRTDPNLHATTYGYDLAGRLTSTTDPLSHAWSLTYDPNGNVATRTDANNQTTTYAYDALNRLTSITYAEPSTPAVTFAYDGTGNRTSMVDGGGTETYAYDALNRVTSVTRGTVVFGYGYDLAGNVTSRTYPGQTAHTFTYDDDGRLSTANGATYTYDPAANLVTAATPDGLTERYSYDRAGRLLEVAHTSASATLSRFSYGLDAVGNRTAMTTREGTVTYRYDELDRLTEACWSPTTCPSGPPAAPLPCLQCVGGLLSRPAATVNPPPGETYRAYTYDPVGNRLTESSDAGATTYQYDNADRVTSVTPPGQTAIPYAFDNNGNQTAAGATTFTYDLADRLKTATVGSTTETYAYAGDGVRLSASTGALAAQTTKFLWDRAFGLPQVAIERNGSDALLRSYRYGLDLLRQTAGSTNYYYHHDGLGSVADVASSTGASLSWNEYYPYGLVRQAGSGAGAPVIQPFGFTGEQLDAFSGLYHLRARQYDPALGRFLSVDPVASAAIDPYVASYVYARNNPTLLMDPSGKWVWTLAGGLVGGLAGLGGYTLSTWVTGAEWDAGQAGVGFVAGAAAGAACTTTLVACGSISLIASEVQYQLSPGQKDAAGYLMAGTIGVGSAFLTHSPAPITPNWSRELLNATRVARINDAVFDFFVGGLRSFGVSSLASLLQGGIFGVVRAAEMGNGSPK